MINFGKEDNIGVIDAAYSLRVLPNLMDYFLPNQIPLSLKEVSMEAVRSRGFKSIHHESGIFYLDILYCSVDVAIINWF